VTSSDVSEDVVIYTTNFGVEQLHMGLEIDATYRVIDPLRLKGFVSLGNWRYQGESVTRISDEEQNIIGEETVDVDGGKVGDAAQTTFGLGADWRISDRFSIDADYRHYADLYANVGAVKDNLKLPSFGIMDFGASYRLPIGQKTNNLYFRGNINNLFDKKYISELSTNIKSGDADADGEKYYGVDTANQGFMLHSGWAYITLIVLVVAVINAIIGLTSKKDYKDKDLRISLFSLIVSHIQLIIGIIAYFVSAQFSFLRHNGMGAAMKEPDIRLYVIEHPLMMILAIILITMGFSKHKKQATDQGKFKTIALYYGIALIFVLSRIPWSQWLSY
jgi:hypothetical protein